MANQSAVKTISANLTNRRFMLACQLDQVKAAEREYRDNPQKLQRVAEIKQKILLEFADVA
jgi:hypothetical protein